MQLMELPAWSEKYFAAESRPSDAQARRWARKGSIPARKVGGTWFIDEHAWLASEDPETADLVQRVLDGR